ncbi:MAG: ATP-binding protein [Phormidesmis sp.]
MTAIASPEFIALCRTQLQLLTQRLTQSSAALYIADVTSQAGEQASFVPVVSYPESLDSWVVNFERASAAHFDAASAQSRQQSASQASDQQPSKPQTNWESAQAPPPVNSQQANSQQVNSQQPHPQALALPGSAIAEMSSLVTTTSQNLAFSWPDALHPEQRLVTPLVYTDVVVGLLVAVRPDRAWNSDEREHIESVGASLAGGCVLERRNQWLQGQLAHKRGLQSRQSEVFHNLLHQFRNPLTAVSTFGQLMVKKLEPDDPNAPIATGIVRENKRLRELVSHFDQAVAIGDADIAADGAADRGSAERTLQRPQLGPQQSCLPASEAVAGENDASGSQVPVFDASAIDLSANYAFSSGAISAGIVESGIVDPGAESTNQGVALHGLGKALVLSAQHLPDMVEPVLAVAGIVAAEKGVSLQAQVAEDTPPVWGDEEALGEVVTNLVDNAIKYSPANATVWVQTGVSREAVGLAPDAVHASSAHADTYSLQVSSPYQAHTYQPRGYQGIVVGDTGPGIPAEDLPHLFERNYRGIQALSDIPGTGLGLAIAQSLIQDMGGFIEVISPAIGTPWLPVPPTHPDGLGTVFVVWLREVDRGAEGLH